MEALFKWLLRFLFQQLKAGQSFGCVLILLTGTYAEVMAQEQYTPAATLPLSISILYFDQSSYQLRPRVKTTLDSMARLLVRQSTLMASVTGYTDNIGKHELNMALAKYRAKTVETYLKQLGVLENQIIVKWEGPDTKASAHESEAVKTISRRVSILLYPR
ncbi:OmpA family protein [Spirosoma flavum]|uniref:OmpA family protein n=1 Tax=Spirosoma flavum TaxID=2048557 RepID=A0ABW6ALK7_9BACT